MSTPKQFQRAADLFHQAVKLPPPQRSDFLSRECGTDDALRREVESLLDHDATAQTESNAIDAGMGAALLAGDIGHDLGQHSESGALPEHIGGYRIIRKLGAGGMGEVFEAEQEAPKRLVALKVIRAGYLTPKLIKRFEHEAFVLGQLQHPGIAHIYESGVVGGNGQQQPYFVMELIRGARINTFSKQQGLTTRQRLELMARVCDAVQHAHQKGIIHRDLKPANILVVEQGTGTDHDTSGTGTTIDVIGQPKILDFGIARVTDGDVHAVTVQTDVGQMVGTLAYMSPEQVEGDSRNLDTRCDVYALGVVLFQLLTGELPFNITGRSVAEAARIVRDEDPASASSIDRSLRGDVNTIIAKAIEKDRERRYDSAALLAADIRRYLHSEPITARPAGTFYQLRKFAARNKGLVGGALAAILALSAGLIVSSVLLVRMTRERDAKQAALEASVKDRNAKQAALEASQEVTRFFTDMIARATPESLGKDTTVREMVDLAADDIDQEFQGRPLLEARIRKTIGSTYLSLSEYDRAHQQAARALAILETTPNADSRDLYSARLLQAQLHFYRQEYEAAIQDFDVVIAAAKKIPDFEVSVGELMSTRALAALRLNRLPEAEQGMIEAVRLVTETKGENSAASLAVKGRLAELYSRSFSEKAESLYKEIIERSKEIQGASHPETLALIGNLAGHYMRLQRDQDAVELLQEILDTQTRVQGAAHRQTLISVNNLAVALIDVGRLDEAMSLTKQALTTSNEAHGESSATSLFLTNALAAILCKKPDQYEEAEEVVLKSIRLHREVQGPNAEGTYSAERQLLIHYVRHGNLEQAIEWGQTMLDRLSDALPEGHPWFVEIRYYVALAHFKAKRYNEAERILRAIETGANSIWRPAIRKKLAEICEILDRPEEAAHWRAKP